MLMKASNFSLINLLYYFAASDPKAGDTKRIITADIKYQESVMAGPCHPTASESFLENKIISRRGLEKSEYIELRQIAHLSIS